MPNWKKLIVSGSDANLNSLNITTDLTGSNALITNDLDVQGNIGSGISNPDSKLHIVRNDSSESAHIKVEQDGSGDAVIDYVLTDTTLWRVGIDNNSADAFKWGVGSFSSYERMSLSTAGVLTTLGLNVSGNITTTGNYSGSVNTNYFGDEFNAHGDDANSGFTLLSLGNKPQVYSFNSKLQIGNQVDGSHISLNNPVTGSNALITNDLDVLGNVTVGTGIGVGTTTIYSNSINLNNSGTVRIGNAEFLSKSSNDLSIYQNKITIQQGGNVGIGTTSPSEKLTVEGNISASGDFYIDGAIFDTSNVSGTSGQVLSSTATGTAWIDTDAFSSTSSEAVLIAVKNTSGGTITEGTPVYETGTVGATETLTVSPADASDSTKMPAIGILTSTLNNNGQGYAIVTGIHKGITTSPIDGVTPTTNTTLYVKAGGGLTTVKPTGASNLIQNVGKVGKVSGGSAGSIVVSSIMRSNDIPNLPEGKIWVGSNNYSVTSSLVHLDEPNERLGIGTTSPSTVLEISSTGVNGVDISQSASNASQSGRLFFTTNTASEGFALFNSNGTFQVNSGGIPNNTSGTNRISIIGSSGNVGIGTTTPSANLDIENASGVTIDINSSSGDGQFRFQDAGTTKWSIGRDNTQQNFVFSNSAGLSSDNVLTLAHSTGNVGIGMSSPVAKLHVYQNDTEVDTAAGITIEQDGTGDAALSFLLTGTKRWRLGIDNNDSDKFKISDSTNLASSNRLTIDTSGNVGIGTTGPGSKLHVEGSIQLGSGAATDDNSLIIYGNNGTASRYIKLIHHNASSSSIQTNNTYLSISAANYIVLGSNTLIYEGVKFSNDKKLEYQESDNSYFTVLNVNSSNLIQIGSVTSTSTGGDTAFYHTGLEKMRIKSTGQVQINDYGSGTFTGTAAYTLAVDSSGNIIETDEVVTGTGTKDKIAIWSDTDTLSSSGSFGYNNRTLQLNDANHTAIQITAGESEHNTINFVSGSSSVGRVGWHKQGYFGSSAMNVNPSPALMLHSDNGIDLMTSNTGSLSIKSGSADVIIDSKVNLGIGIASPTHKLEVIGDSNDTMRVYRPGNRTVLNIDADTGRTSTLAIDIAGTTQYYVGMPTQAVSGLGARFAISYQGAPSFVLEGSSGKIGIGVATPSHKLHIIDGTDSFKYGADIGNGFDGIKLTGGAPGIEFVGNGDDFIVGKITAGLAFFNSTDSSYKMILNDDGDLGIGVSAATGPTRTLDVRGGAIIAGDTPANPVGGTLEIYKNGADSILTIHEDAGTHNARLRFRAGGNDTYIQNTPSTFEIRTEGNLSSGTAPLKITSNGDVTLGYDLTVAGKVTAQEFHTEFVSASIMYESGSTKFGDTSDDTHDFTGSLNVAGDVNINSNYPAHTVANDLTIGKTTTGDHGLTIVTSNTNTAAIYFGDNDHNDAGRIRYQHSNNAMRFDTNRAEAMRINSSGNVGIGTTSPGANLDVAAVTNAVIRLTSTGDGLGADAALGSLQFYGNDASAPGAGVKSSIVAKTEASLGDDSNLIFSTSDGITNNVERMRIAPDGNVGIGTTSPNYKLSVDDNTITTVPKTVLQFDAASIADNGGYNIDFRASSNDLANRYVARIRGIREASGALSQLSFWTESGSALEQRMTIRASGNVGIGTTTPSTKLEVNGDIGIGRVAGGYTFRETVGGGERASIKSNATNELIFSYGASTEAMRIGSTGNVGIGTTSPSQKLEVAGDTPVIRLTDTRNLNVGDWDDVSLGRIEFKTSDTTTPGARVLSEIEAYSGPGAASGPESQLRFKTSTNSDTSATTKMTIDASGNVGIGTTSPGYKLTVAGDAGFSDWIYASKFYPTSSTTDILMQTGAGRTITLDPTSTGKVLMPNGNVGIGTTGPGAKLDIVGSSIGLRIKKPDLSDVLRVYTQGSGVFVNNGNFHVEDNVGIGTTSPSAKLDIEGDLQVKGVNISNQENLDVDTGTETIATVVKANYDAAFFDFVIKNGTNLRAGTVFAIHDGTNVEFTETSTNDLGDTSDVTLSVDISGTDMRLRATTTSDNWIIKSLVRTI